MVSLTDSGILLRLFEVRDPLHSAVKLAVDTLGHRGELLAPVPQNIAEFWNVCTRPATARGGLGLSAAATELRLQDVEKRFAVLTEPPGTYPLWRQLVVTHAVKGKQVHDARLVALMTGHGLTHILTLNESDSARYPGFTVLDPIAIAASVLLSSPPPVTGI